MDSNTVNRVGASCGRQNYHPTIAITGQSLSPAMGHDPNLDADGMVSSLAVAPWFTTGTAASDEFRAALAAYGKGVQPYQAGWGWVSGQLLEKAGAKPPEPPTSAAIRDGLWSITN